MQPSLISHPPGKSPSQSWSLPPPSTQHRRYSTRQEERKLPPHISHLTAKRALKRRLHKTPIALPFRFLLLFPHLRSQGRHFPPRIMYISCRCRATIRRNHHHWPPSPSERTSGHHKKACAWRKSSSRHLFHWPTDGERWDIIDTDAVPPTTPIGPLHFSSYMTGHAEFPT